jgi:hypothetical protein
MTADRQERLIAAIPVAFVRKLLGLTPHFT